MFEHLGPLLITLIAIFSAGKGVMRLGMPPMVGELLAGVILGPNLLDYAPKTSSLKLLGEFGLVLLMVDAGLSVDVKRLGVIGPRGVAAAVTGSLCPISITFLIAYFGFALSGRGALACGLTLSPTSAGITLNILKAGGVLDQPVGQVIIAAAVVDDVLALVMLGQLEALDDPTLTKMVAPLLSSLFFLICVGSFVVLVFPKLMSRYILPCIPKSMQPKAMLLMLAAEVLALLHSTYYSWSSHLLGAFLAGLSWSTYAPVKEMWAQQAGQPVAWLTRLFFAATIGFEVPVRDFWTTKVIGRAAIMAAASLGKLVAGVYALPSRPYEMTTMALAMCVWGEFAFLVATKSKAKGLIDTDMYSALLLNVVASEIYSPYALKYHLGKISKHEDVVSTRANGLKALELEPHNEGKVYFHLSLCCPYVEGLVDTMSSGAWGTELTTIETQAVLQCEKTMTMEVYARDERDLYAQVQDSPDQSNGSLSGMSSPEMQQILHARMDEIALSVLQVLPSTLNVEVHVDTQPNVGKRAEHVHISKTNREHSSLCVRLWDTENNAVSLPPPDVSSLGNVLFLDGSKDSPKALATVSSGIETNPLMSAWLHNSHPWSGAQIDA